MCKNQESDGTDGFRSSSGKAYRRLAGVALVASALLIGGGGAVADSPIESIEKRIARQAVLDLRRSTFLVTECENAFLTFWKSFIAEGDHRMIRDPFEGAEDIYFGLGNPASAPLLSIAQETCAVQTGARGDLVVRVLKEREDRKLKRQRKLKHAERIIGY